MRLSSSLAGAFMNPSSPQRVTVEQLAEEFLERYRRGERPALSEYTERHPEFAEQIHDLFPALVMMEQIAPQGDSSAAFSFGAPAPGRPGRNPEQLGDFRILREIGRGGMGIVYEAEQVSLGRHVALKVLPPRRVSNPKMRQRFEREAKAAAKLHHTNIVQVFGVGVYESTPYYAMQFIQGLALDAVIEELERMSVGDPVSPPSSAPTRIGSAARKDLSAFDVARSLLSGQFEESGAGPGDSSPPDVTENSPATGSPSVVHLSDSLTLSSSAMLPGQSSAARQTQAKKLTYWQSVARVGVQVADALDYAHKQGICHRDIKPSNLLLDTRGIVWVTDFGLAKTDDQQHLTHPGDVLGTLRYMPPEAFEGRGDARGDIYALGLTLYELLALAPAFDEKDRHKLVRQVMTGQPIRLGKRNPEVPRDLETIIHKAIDREPRSRYQTAGELAADLERFLRDEPIQARRISLVESLARWARHHKGVAAALAVIALLLVAVTLGSILAAVSFRRLATEADTARTKAEQATEAERWEHYRSDIAGAASALQLQNVGAARLALEEAPEKFRNWEWQHFHNQLDGAQAVLRGHQQGVRSSFFNSDGQRVISTSADGTIRFWDTASARELHVQRLGEGPLSWWRYPDRKEMIALSNAPTVRLLDPLTEKEPAPPFSAAQPIRFLVTSPDGRRLAFVYGAEKTPHLVDRTTGTQIDLSGHTLPILGLVFSSDGKLLATSSGDNTIRLWDGVTGQAAGVLRGHTTNIDMLAFRPDGQRLVSGSQYPENAVRLWDIATSQEAVPMLSGHRNGVLTRLQPRRITDRVGLTGPDSTPVGRGHGEAHPGIAGSHGGRDSCRLQPQRQEPGDEFLGSDHASLGRGDR
jgi:serine/threonine protein kinase